MKPRNLKHIDISHTFNLVTRADRAKIGEDQFIKVSGVFNTLEGIVAMRDFGSKSILSSYPSLNGSPYTFVSGYLFYDAVEREHSIIALMKDGDGNLSIWVHDNGWENITPPLGQGWFFPAAGHDDQITVNWLGVDSRRKVIMTYSYGGQSFLPVSIAKQSLRSRFGIEYQPGWYVERHQLIDKAIEIGTIEAESGDVSWNFDGYFLGQVPSGQAGKVFTLKNSGLETATVESLTITDNFDWDINTPAFEILSPPSTPFNLAPGATQDVHLVANANPADPDPYEWVQHDVQLRANLPGGFVRVFVGALFKEGPI